MANARRQSEIVETALELLDEKGADAVSLRAVAERMGVRLNTVSWHVKTKGRLLELMADAIVGRMSLEDLPPDPADRSRELLRRYRRALLAVRDGAKVVTGTYAAEEHTLRTAEAIVGALLECGSGEREAAWTAWTAVYFTLGLTQEEQGAPASIGEALDAAVAPEAHPSLARVLAHLAGGTFEERFDFGLDLIIRSPGRAEDEPARARRKR
ncbi:TetR/AcrR family transcriptional regulator C-terminal domain-containing protein [Nonomuraea angiospora]|uniref:TetR/AcrR family transcriptional regulator C-terminal domain-containing protein n=1 Tax=Nonomuraea angiospora TaxID=46172 RepID=UPI0029AB79D7|nr:TetR/AcrR family transcriptional regulator C-terminal domain-containing protein [Nonomuraea angiospora]MDX3108262.1 TetR/AcrR family transcriptional regulator C-terminal domain-containing protein [Nonomuraea angiospora]